MKTLTLIAVQETTIQNTLKYTFENLKLFFLLHLHNQKQMWYYIFTHFVILKDILIVYNYFCSNFSKGTMKMFPNKSKWYMVCPCVFPEYNAHAHAHAHIALLLVIESGLIEAIRVSCVATRWRRTTRTWCLQHTFDPYL